MGRLVKIVQLIVQLSRKIKTTMSEQPVQGEFDIRAIDFARFIR